MGRFYSDEIHDRKRSMRSTSLLRAVEFRACRLLYVRNRVGNETRARGAMVLAMAASEHT